MIEDSLKSGMVVLGDPFNPLPVSINNTAATNIMLPPGYNISANPQPEPLFRIILGSGLSIYINFIHLLLFIAQKNTLFYAFTPPNLHLRISQHIASFFLNLLFCPQKTQIRHYYQQ